MKRKELISTLELVRPALSNKELVPVFNDFCFEEGKVYAYNDSVAAVAPCDLDIILGLNGEVLLGLLRNYSGEKFKFEVTEEECLLIMGKTKAKFTHSRKDDFLFSEPKVKDTKIKINAELLSALKNCLLTASEDSALPALMGVALNFDQGTRMYSCDGDALSRYEFDEKYKAKGQFVMSREFCHLVLRTADKLKLETGKLAIDEDWAYAEIGPMKLYGRVIISDTPFNYEKVIQDSLGDDDPVYFPQPKGLQQALSRAIIMVDKNSWKTNLTIANGKMRLTTNSREKGVIRDAFNLKKGSHPDVEANVNSEIFLRALKSCNEISINELCSAFKNGEKLLQLVSHLDT